MSENMAASAGSIDGRKVSREQRVLAARIRVKADKHLGVKTPQWIVDLAAQKAS